MAANTQSPGADAIESIEVALMPAWSQLSANAFKDEADASALIQSVYDLEYLSDAGKDALSAALKNYVEAQRSEMGEGYEGVSDLARLIGNQAALKAILVSAVAFVSISNLDADASVIEPAPIAFDPMIEAAVGGEVDARPGAPSMKADLFLRVMNFTALWEGGKVDHPDDPGGKTNLGITQTTFDAWRDSQGLDRLDVFEISAEEAHKIYKRDYWSKVQGDELPERVALAVFDFAVNCGHRRAVKALQKAVGVSQDGVIGSQTLAAVHAADPHVVFEAVNKERSDFYTRLVTKRPKLEVFAGGWSNRVDALIVAGSGDGFESLFSGWSALIKAHWAPNVLMGRLNDEFVE
ncbi:MAG: glycosyl hydrolase 108 family protein [Pseudomonadota bacterium]